MPKFFIKTYGCQMNERDSEQVAHSLIARGYERADSEREADVVLLNTCSVRDLADQKALGKMGMLGRIANERPQVVFGFLGCMAQARGASLLKNLPHVDLVVGTQKFHRVADYVDHALERKLTRAMDDPRFSIVDVDEEPGSQSTIRHQQLAPKQATAFENRSEEHTSELQSHLNLVCRLLLEKKSKYVTPGAHPINTFSSPALPQPGAVEISSFMCLPSAVK